MDRPEQSQAEEDGMNLDTRRTYYEVLSEAHRYVRPRGYLEIGVHEGHSLQLAAAETRCVGIDPEPNVQFATEATIRATTSDRYFATHDLADDLDAELDLVFIDGLHLFEQALRDFANVETRSHSRTVITIHDCLPVDTITSARNRTTMVWSGDVWKTVVALHRHRPDLTVVTLDAQPTGLGVITGLDPTSTVISDRFDDIVAELLDVEFDESYRSELNVAPADGPTLAAVFGQSGT